MTSAPFKALAAIAENLRFFTRLPLGGASRAPDFADIGWAAPLAGAIVGAFGAAVFFISQKLGFPGIISAILAVMTEVAATGALHEDGLADVADGFGGGRNRNAKLAIMRDSRIGAYGATTLFLMLFLRVEATAALARSGTGFAAAGLVLAAAAARGAALTPLAWAPPARGDGVGASAAGLDPRALRGVAATLAVLAAGLGLASLEVPRAFFACLTGVLAARMFVAFAMRQIGGQTGDVCGAVASLAEVGVLLALLIGGRGD